MVLWVDDIRIPPEIFGHSVFWAKSTNQAIDLIMKYPNIALIDIDHDAGDYAKLGGDYIRLLDWLEATGRNYPIRIHTMNPVGAANMRRVIQRNGWKEVF